jgi:archaetidylinositol phosphate synthase
MSNPEFRQATRTQASLLSGLEKKALLWMAARLPAWVGPDLLTALSLVAMFGAGLAYWAAGKDMRWLWAVNACIALNWFGDSLDGTVARVRNRQRPRYGFYVDHLVDCLGASAMLIGLGYSGFMGLREAMVLLIIYLMLSIESYLATYTLGHFQLSHYGFSPTELRVLLIAGNFALFYRTEGMLGPYTFKVFDAGAWCGAVGMAALLVISAVRNTMRLYKEETLP